MTHKSLRALTIATTFWLAVTTGCDEAPPPQQSDFQSESAADDDRDEGRLRGSGASATRTNGAVRISDSTRTAPRQATVQRLPGTADATPAAPAATADQRSAAAPATSDATNESAGLALDACYGGDEFSCQVEALVFEKTNERRVANGLVPFEFAPQLGFAARVWSKQQFEVGQISHDGFPDQRTASLQAEFGDGNNATVQGENVASFSRFNNMSPEEIANQLVEQWWQSEGHRENILWDFRSLGVGYHGDGEFHYATQLFGDEQV